MTDEVPTAQPPRQPKHPDKTCEICGRSFSRNEHVVRHRRTHTSERPFACPFCNTNFPRADVKDKHMKRFHTSQGLEDYRSKKARSSQRERSRLACDQCRRGKLKCDNHHPCQPCRNKHISCTVSSSSRRPGRPRNHEQRLDQDGITSENALDFFELLDGPTETMADFVPTCMTPSIPSLSTTTESCQSTVQPEGQVSLNPNITESVEQINHAMHIPSDLTTTTIEAIFPPDDGMFFDGQDSINSAFPDFDLMDGLWQLSSLGVSGWLDNLGDAAPGQEGNDLPKTTLFNLEPSKPSHIDQGVAIMVEFLQRRSRASSPTKDAKRSWYSLPPRLQMYDDEVINILLNVGRAHLSTTLRIFSDFEATPETSQQLCLAMAAIGALFSTAEGSSTVAKSLYNDARRLELEAELRHEPSSLVDALNSAKTSILLEMYGVCSGDKRSYEFWEVFHYNTMNGLKSCLRNAPLDSPSFEAVHQQLLLVIESIYILDAYRVLLLLRPPCFLSPIEPNASYPDGIYESRKISMTTLKSLMTPTGSIPAGPPSIQHLAMISAYSWMPSPRGHECLRRPQLWKTEFVELALERWVVARTQESDPPDLSQSLIYHLTYINLHSNLAVLQRFAHEFIRPAENQISPKAFDSLRAWVHGPDFPIALWHAECMLKRIRSSLPPLQRRNDPGVAKTRFLEPPHLPYCVYFATLIVWYGGTRAGSIHGSRNGCIEAAVQILSRLRAPVSKVVSSALCELSTGTP